MVAVVSGNGLGLFNTSLSQLGAAWGGPAGLGQGRESQLVNIATGNLVLQDQDENLAVRGFSAGFLRTYNSRGTVASAGQDGFVTGYERNVVLTGTLNAVGSTMTLNTGDGQTQVFTYTSTNVYTSTAGDGAHDTLTWSSGTSTWTLVEGSTRREEQYANHADATLKGRLIRIRDLTSDGTTPAQFDVIYDANNRVSEVRSVDGAGATADAILFGYDTTFPTRLVAVATREGGVIKSQLWYEYDTYGRLSAVTTDLAPTTEASVLTARAGNDVWNATASANNGYLFRTSYTYTTASATDLRLASVTQGDGTVTSYTYEADGAGGYRVKTVTLGDTNTNDADGAGETVTFTYGSNTTDVTDSLGRVWTYKYDASKQLTEVDGPAIAGQRDVTTYTYDASGNVTQVKAVRGATVLSQMDYAYDANGNQTWQWDALGNTVQRWFSSTNQVTAENHYFNVDPDRTGPSAPTGALTNRYIYDAQNRVHFTWTSLGEVTEYTYATSGNGIGQRASVRTYLGLYNGTTNTTESDYIAWATAAQKSNSTLIEYSYDAKGRLSQTTSYASVDSSGNGVFDTATDITRFAYDAHGLLLQQCTVRGASRTLTGTPPAGSEVIDYAYDGLGRLLSVLKRDWSRAPLSSRPDPVSNPLGYRDWDAVTLLTTYAYNDAGKQIVVTFDTADAVNATTGAVITDLTHTQTQTYNAAHRLVSNTEVGTTADLVTPATTTVTRTSQYYYDSAGQLRATQDAAGGRHYYFYDAKGAVVGEVDATGAMTEYTRDGAGRVIDTIGYSARVDTTTWLSGSTVVPTDIATVRPVWSTAFTSLPIAGLYTTQVDNPAYANEIQYQSASGRLAFITQYNATTINAYIQRSPATLHALTENISYRGEISTGPTQNNTYLLFSLQNTQPAGSAQRRTSIFFRNGNIYLNNQIGTIGSNTLIGASAANTTYVVEARAREGLIEYTIYVKGSDPSTGWTVSTEAESQDWGGIKLAVSGHAASDMTTGDALYLDNLSESDLGVRHNTRTYDAAGRLATSTDAAGTVTTYTYDAAHRLLKTDVTDAGNTATRTTRYFYDYDNRQVATLDAAGYLTETIYDLGGRVSKTIRYANLTPSAYRAAGTLAQLKTLALDATNDQTTRYYYNGRNQQVGVLNAEGYLTEYVYDEANNQRAEKAYAKQLTGTDTDTLATLRTQATVTPPLPTEPVRTTQRTFNGLGQLIKELNAEGTVTAYSYDDAGRLVRTEAAQGTTVVREGYRRYDVFDQLIGELSGEQAADAIAAQGGKLLNDSSLTETQLNNAYNNYGTTHSYDLVGRRIESKDALGNKTWYFYDAQGRQTYLVRGVAQDNAGVTGALNSYGEVTETRYSAFGEVLDSLTYTGRIAIATPGDRNSVQTAIGALMFASAIDTRRQYSYDTRGLLSRSIDAEGTVNRYTYTGFGQLDTETRAAGTSAAITIDHTYDARGLETSRVDALGVAGVQRSVSQTFDAFGRVISAIDGRGTATTFTYDRLGRQISHSQTIEGRVETWQSSYDAFDRTLRQTDAMGRVTTFAYVDSTRTLTITTPEGVTTQTVHNRFGQTVTVTDGNNASTTYVYDKNGDLTQTTNPLGQTSTNTYDVLRRLQRSTDATGRNVDFTYDAARRVLSRIEDPTGLALTTRYSYDAQSHALTVTDPSGRVTAMTYDQEGRLLSQALDPNGFNLRTTYSYDALGRQVTVVEAAGTTAARTTQYTYDALGRRVSETLAPGTLNLTTTYTYDADDNVIGRTDATGNLTRYAYDEANRLRFTVDALGGLTETNYDADGRVTRTRQYIKPISLSTLASTWTRTQIGALAVGDALDSTQYRVYDQDGRLSATTDAVGGVTTYSYDGANRVIANTRYGNGANLSALTTALKAGTATAADLVAALTPDASIDQVVSYTYDAASRRLRQTDGAGHITRSIFDAAGRVVYSIDPLGNITRNWYDGAGRLCATRQFTTPFVTATISDSTTAAQLDGLLIWHASDQGRYLVYDPSGKLRYSYDVSGALTEYSYDSAGRQTSSRAYAANYYVDSATNTQLYAGTAYGSLVEPTANYMADRVTYTVYDALGQARVRLDGAGDAVACTYDAAGRVLTETHYATAVSLAGLAAALEAGTATVAQVTPSANANDQLAYHVYDAAGRLRFTINRLGQVSERMYDAAGRLVSTRDYANPLVLANETALVTAMTAGTATPTTVTAELTVDATRDSQTFVVFDGQGQARFSIDALGGITEQRYDAAGRVSQTLAYGTALPTTVNANLAALRAGTVAATTVAGWVSNQESAARLTTLVYDAAGRMRFTLTRDSASTNVVTERRYNALGQVIADVAYATPILNTAAASSASGAQRLTRYVYDAAGQLRFTIDDAGAVSERVYDALGQMVEERRYQTLIPAGTAATESAVLAAIDAAEQATWSTNLASLSGTGLDTTDIGAFGNSLTWVNGQLVFKPADYPSTAFPNIYRTQTHAPSENVVFNAELITGATLSSTWLTFGVENNVGSPGTELEFAL